MRCFMNKDLGKLSFFQKPHSSDCWRLRQFPELRISMAAVRIPFRQAVIMILKLNQNLLWIRCLIWKVDPFSTSGDLIIAKSNHPMFPNLFVKAVANLQTVLLTSNATFDLFWKAEKVTCVCVFYLPLWWGVSVKYLKSCKEEVWGVSAEYFLLGNKKSKLDLGCARLLLQYLPLLITIKGVQAVISCTLEKSQIIVTAIAISNASR